MVKLNQLAVNVWYRAPKVVHDGNYKVFKENIALKTQNRIN